MKLLLTLIAASALPAVLGGCDIHPQNRSLEYQQQLEPTPIIVPTEKHQSRITVKRIDVVSDNLAYGNKRGLYLITDNITKREYVGLSGVGITDLGSHSSGKARSVDER